MITTQIEDLVTEILSNYADRVPGSVDTSEIMEKMMSMNNLYEGDNLKSYLKEETFSPPPKEPFTFSFSFPWFTSTGYLTSYFSSFPTSTTYYYWGGSSQSSTAEYTESAYSTEDEISTHYYESPLTYYYVPDDEDDDSDVAVIKSSKVDEIVNDAVKVATVSLENEIIRLKNRIPMMKGEQLAPIILPSNEGGVSPSELSLWYPTNLRELLTMRDTEEPLLLDKESKRIQKLTAIRRVEKLLEHYSIFLPPSYPVSESIRIFYEFILYGDSIKEEVYSSLTN